MRMTAVVVNEVASILEEQSGALERAGFTVVTASSFTEARALLERNRPSLLVAPVRLGAYNGIHLAMRAQWASPLTRVVVIGPHDGVLERDARAVGAVYLLEDEAEGLVDTAQRIVVDPTGRRRWPRVRLNGRIEARVADGPVRLIDVSRGGFRMESSTDTADANNKTFRVHVPRAGVSAEARSVWTAVAQGPDRTICGASVLSADRPPPREWTAFVESMQGVGDP